MKKQLLLLSLLLSLPLLLSATTYIGNITLNTQAGLDAFKLTTMGADTVIGNITISGADITNLDSLENLQCIQGYLLIQSNAMLANLDGLQNINSIQGFLAFASNPMLENIDGLQNVNSIQGFLSILRNASLENIDGLQNINSIQGDLRIQSNVMLSNLDGLQNINSIQGRLRIEFNPNLSACCGLLRVLDDNDDGAPGPRMPLGSTPPDVSGNITINNNASGCNDPAAIVSGGACARILPPPVPTMSQWGLFLFGLTVLTLGVVGIWNVKKVMPAC